MRKIFVEILEAEHIIDQDLMPSRPIGALGIFGRRRSSLCEKKIAASRWAFNVVAHAAALRRLRMNYSKRNRVTDFPLCSVFSHGLAPLRTSAPELCTD